MVQISVWLTNSDQVCSDKISKELFLVQFPYC